MQCVFDGRLAANSGTVGVFFIAGADTLNHDHILRITDIPLLHFFRQLELGHYPITLAVQILL